MKSAKRGAIEILEGQMPLFGEEHAFARQAEETNRRVIFGTLRSLKDQLMRRTYAVERVEEMVRNGVLLPDVAEALGLPAVTPRSTRSFMWGLRAGTDASIVVDLLAAARRHGLSEDELVTALRERGRLANARYPRRSVHWCLTNLRKRTGGAVQRLTNGRWKLLRPIARKAKSQA